MIFFQLNTSFSNDNCDFDANLAKMSIFSIFTVWRFWANLSHKYATLSSFYTYTSPSFLHFFIVLFPFPIHQQTFPSPQHFFSFSFCLCLCHSVQKSISITQIRHPQIDFWSVVSQWCPIGVRTQDSTQWIISKSNPFWLIDRSITAPDHFHWFLWHTKFRTQNAEHYSEVAEAGEHAPEEQLRIAGGTMARPTTVVQVDGGTRGRGSCEGD